MPKPADPPDFDSKKLAGVPEEWHEGRVFKIWMDPNGLGRWHVYKSKPPVFVAKSPVTDAVTPAAAVTPPPAAPAAPPADTAPAAPPAAPNTSPAAPEKTLVNLAADKPAYGISYDPDKTDSQGRHGRFNIYKGVGGSPDQRVWVPFDSDKKGPPYGVEWDPDFKDDKKRTGVFHIYKGVGGSPDQRVWVPDASSAPEAAPPAAPPQVAAETPATGDNAASEQKLEDDADTKSKQGSALDEAKSRAATGGGAGSYTVRDGDSLSKIAAANGTTVTELVRLNPQYKENPGLIYAGDRIKLPGGAPTGSSYGSSGTGVGGADGSSPHVESGGGYIPPADPPERVAGAANPGAEKAKPKNPYEVKLTGGGEG